MVRANEELEGGTGVVASRMHAGMACMQHASLRPSIHRHRDTPTAGSRRGQGEAPEEAKERAQGAWGLPPATVCVCCAGLQPHPSHHHHHLQNQDLTEEDVAFKAKQKADAAAMKKAAEALKAKKK